MIKSGNYEIKGGNYEIKSGNYEKTGVNTGDNEITMVFTRFKLNHVIKSGKNVINCCNKRYTEVITR